MRASYTTLRHPVPRFVPVPVPVPKARGADSARTGSAPGGSHLAMAVLLAYCAASPPVSPSVVPLSVVPLSASNSPSR
jgi:hypothetical protein